MAKSKKLSFAEYNKLDKMFHERKKVMLTVTLSNGDTKEYEHSIATTFKPTDIQKLTIDYLSLLTELQNSPNVTVETFFNANLLLNALVVKYFSDVPIPTIDHIQSVINTSEVLFNLGIMEQLFDNDKGFLKSEMDKLGKEIEKDGKSIGEKFGDMVVNASLNEVEESGIQESE